MTIVLTDGPMGLEATHVWTPADGSPLVLNDRTVLPCLRFDKIGGFNSLPDSDDNRAPRTARVGESVFPSLVRGKTITPEGRILGRSRSEVRQQRTALVTAFGQRDQEGVWSAVPNAALGSATDYWQTAGRVIGLEIDEDFQADVDAMPSPWQLGFLLTVRLSDPRWTWTDGQSAGPNSTQVTVTNQGSAPAELLITVAGASGTVTVFNDTIGAQLKFTGLPSGTLVIDTAARTALTGTDDAMPYLNSLLSNWWDRGVPALQADASNIIRQTGGSSITVAFKHTSW